RPLGRIGLCYPVTDETLRAHPVDVGLPAECFVVTRQPRVVARILRTAGRRLVSDSSGISVTYIRATFPLRKSGVWLVSCVVAYPMLRELPRLSHRECAGGSW